MKVISYAIWGKNKLYNQGAIINVNDAEKFYPGWKVRIYCDENSPVLEELKTLNCEVVTFSPTMNSNGMYAWNNAFWRITPAAEQDVDITIFRDADSRLSVREVAAVDEWLKSGKALHVMHDYPGHYITPICSGMWGIRGGWLQNINQMIERWCEAKKMTAVYEKVPGVDETFLAEVVWPMFKYGNYIGHGSHYDKATAWGDNEHPFPPHGPMEHGYFVGQKIQAEPSLKMPNFFVRRK